MKNYTLKIAVILCTLIFTGCKKASNDTADTPEKQHKIEMVTTKGTIELVLYNETPKHRDNFIKIVNDGVLDSLLFHRVIENFMIQAGDINSKSAKEGDTLGSGDLAYKVDAEFLPELFHKRGVLAAARDGNPERASSSTQFYIVHRGPRVDSLIDIDQGRINGWLAEHYMQKDSSYAALYNALEEAYEKEDSLGYMTYYDSIKSLSKSYDKFTKYVIPEAHRQVYRTTGGTPHLDQNYTVFGEVVKGMEVVDAIATVETNALDRPIEDVRIISIKVIEE